MAENSGIAWTTHTFNPWIGCQKVSPGCDHCFAKAWDDRFGGGHWGALAPRRRTALPNWNKLRKWNAKAEKTGVRPWVFVASLADVFDNAVPKDWRTDLWSLVAECRNLNFQFVTKRVGNVFDMAPLDWSRHFPHVGLIATVVTQAECDRDLPKLRILKSHCHISWVGLSIEPQLELVIPKADGLDWVITGGESDQGGQNARRYSMRWAELLIGWGALNGVPVFVKQLGSFLAQEKGYHDHAAAEPLEWPSALRVRQMPRGVPAMMEAA